MLFELLMLVGAAGAEEHRRLFLDALLVDRQEGLERRFHALRKHAGNPLIVADQACEEGGSGPYLYGTVLDESGKLRMWYHFIRKGYRNGYAESVDGLRWTKHDCSVLA